MAPLTTLVLQLPNPMVVPSGAARATRPTPTMPLPPLATFSITMLWPSATFMRSATMRATGSTAPPGGNGTIIVIGREGSSWAAALANPARVAANATAGSTPANDFPMPSLAR